jgi:hypothetical protein
MRNVFPSAVAIALLAVFFSCASSADSQTETVEMRLEHAADLLGSGTDADSLAAAGLLNSVKGRDRSLRLGALTRANKANNEQASSAALAAIGRSERLDIYWTTLVARLSRATAEAKALSLREAEIIVIGILAAQAIPAYQVLSGACRGERLKRDDVVEVCRGIANALQHGDTYITEVMGIAIAKRVWTENSPHWMEATEARRSWEYRAKFLSEADAWNTAHTGEYLDLCAQNQREQDAYKAELIAIGKSPDPPPY